MGNLKQQYSSSLCNYAKQASNLHLRKDLLRGMRLCESKFSISNDTISHRKIALNVYDALMSEGKIAMYLNVYE